MPIQYDSFSYEQPWRPNFELRAALGWLAGTITYPIAAQFTDMPPTPLYVAATVSAAMAINRIIPAIRLLQLQKSLKGHPLKFIPLQDVFKILEENPEKLWWGYGFDWENRHVQRVWDIMRRDWSSVVKSDEDSLGRAWIHGVEHEEKVLVQPLKHLEGHTLIAGTTGSGKAQPLESNVLTPGGFRPMGSLRPGDLVTTPDGGHATIISTHPQGKLDIYRITLEDGRIVEACPDHLWKVHFSAESHAQVLDTRTLIQMLEDGRDIYLPLTQAVSLPQHNLSVDPYLHGFKVASDSCCAAKVPVHLAESGLDVQITHPLQLDPMYLLGSIRQRREVIRGIADFLGQIDERGFLVVKTRYQNLAQQIRQIIWSLGGIAHLDTASNQVVVRIAHPDLKSLMTSSILQDQLPRSSKPVSKVKVLSIAYSRRTRAQCIYIDHPDHLYLTDNFVVTHNTRMFDQLISQAILRGACCIIVDPKGDAELRNNAKRACELAGRPNDYIQFHPAFPEDSIHLDPLANFNRISELASRIASLISTSSGGEVFKDFSQMAINHLIQGLIISERRPTLVGLRRFLEGGAQVLVATAIRRYIENHCPGKLAGLIAVISGHRSDDENKRALDSVRYYNAQVKESFPSVELEGLISMYQHDRTHFAKMVASLLPIMNMLTSDSLGKLLSPRYEPHDVEDITQPLEDFYDSKRILDLNKVFYLGLDSLSDGIVGSAIGSLILSDLTATAGDRYNFGKNLKPINIFIDEAAEVVNEPMIQLLNKSRGSLFTLYVATQTFSDFAARLGSVDKAVQVLGNFNNFVALRLVDNETQKYMSEKLPKTRVKYIMEAQGAGTSSQEPENFSGQHSQRLMEEEVSLFAPEWFGMLPNLEYIANLSGGRIVKGRLPILTHTEKA